MAATAEAPPQNGTAVKPGLSLADALARATRADLQEIESKVELLEGEIESLRALKRVLQVKFGLRTRNGCKTKKASGTPRPSDASSRAKIDVAKYVLHNGPTKAKTLIEQLGIPNTTLYKILDDPWFDNQGGTINITNEARAAVKS